MTGHAKGGGKLGRSETVTIRLDPKLNYLCELAARAQRRTKSSFIEWAVLQALRAFDPATELAKQDEEMRQLAQRFLAPADRSGAAGETALAGSTEGESAVTGEAGQAPDKASIGARARTDTPNG